MLSKHDIRAFMFISSRVKILLTLLLCKECLINLKKSNENLENEERGKPAFVLNNNKLRKAVEADSRTTVRKFAKELNVLNSTIFNHLKEIEKIKKTRQMGTSRIKRLSKIFSL
uniref:HTH_Tnp_IS630 domain-containing protein n=1 Tax=Strongyloides venezuelensis TaxID=75913 RepID=A0A0K0FCB1_STRVS